MAFVYKIKDSTKSGYWDGYNGYRKTHRFSSKGKEFLSLDKLKSTIISHTFIIPPTWEFVKIEKIECVTETFAIDLDKIKKIQELKIKIVKHLDILDLEYSEKNVILGLVDKLIKRDEFDKTSYIILLKKPEGSRWHIPESVIKDCRSILRGLGVKTRTFREHYGAFGMFNKDQALRAKVSLDIRAFVDLDTMRMTNI
jgi:hypothetical protein